MSGGRSGLAPCRQCSKGRGRALASSPCPSLPMRALSSCQSRVSETGEGLGVSRGVRLNCVAWRGPECFTASALRSSHTTPSTAHTHTSKSRPFRGGETQCSRLWKRSPRRVQVDLSANPARSQVTLRPFCFSVSICNGGRFLLRCCARPALQVCPRFREPVCLQLRHLAVSGGSC